MASNCCKPSFPAGSSSAKMLRSPIIRFISPRMRPSSPTRSTTASTLSGSLAQAGRSSATMVRSIPNEGWQLTRLPHRSGSSHPNLCQTSPTVGRSKSPGRQNPSLCRIPHILHGKITLSLALRTLISLSSTTVRRSTVPTKMGFGVFW